MTDSSSPETLTVEQAVQQIRYSADGVSVMGTRQRGGDQPDTWLFVVRDSVTGYDAGVVSCPDGDEDATGQSIVGMLLAARSQFTEARQNLSDAIGLLTFESAPAEPTTEEPTDISLEEPSEEPTEEPAQEE